MQMATKKILIIGQAHSGKLSFTKSLTGSLPAVIPTGSHGGLTHELHLKTAYYEADAGIWIDEFEEEKDLISFCDSYASEEATAVRESLNAVVTTFRDSWSQQSVRHLLSNVKRIADLCDPGTLLLAVGNKSSSGQSVPIPEPASRGTESDVQPDTTQEDYSKDDTEGWEDICLDEGFEYIDLHATGKNAFDERQGIQRALEVIETCDWSASTPEISEEDLLADMMAEDAELNRKLLEIGTDGDEASAESVEDLEKLMQRVLMAREHLQDLDMEERKSQALKLVAEVMR